MVIECFMIHPTSFLYLITITHEIPIHERSPRNGFSATARRCLSMYEYKGIAFASVLLPLL
jgi:hypothetical protein